MQLPHSMNYAAHYDKLINRARNRILTGYKERHHVIPRCMGGSDEADNIVELTAEEHYVAHQLLVKMHPGVRGLSYAAVWMALRATGNRAYGWLRRKCSENKPSPTTRAKISASMLGNKRAHAQRGSKRLPLSPEHRSKLMAALLANPPFLGKTHSLEARAKIRAARARQVITIETRAKMASAMRGKKMPPFSDEHRANIGTAQRGKKRPTRSPEHCAKLSAAKSGKKWSEKRRAAYQATLALV